MAPGVDGDDVVPGDGEVVGGALPGMTVLATTVEEQHGAVTAVAPLVADEIETTVAPEADRTTRRHPAHRGPRPP